MPQKIKNKIYSSIYYNTITIRKRGLFWEVYDEEDMLSYGIRLTYKGALKLLEDVLDTHEAELEYYN